MRSNYIGHRIAAFDHIVKGRHDHARQLRLGYELDRDFRGHTQHAFGTDKSCQQIEARCIQTGVTQLNDVTFDGDHAYAQYVMHRETVFQAMHASGVLRHIAADGTGDLRRRIGGVVQTMRCRCFGDRQIAYARLHHRRSRVRVKFENAIEARGGQHHPISDRRCATGQTGTRATRHDLHIKTVTDLQHGDDLRLVFGQGNDHRQLTIRRQAIALIGPRVFFVEQHRMCGQLLAQGGNHLALTREGKSRFGWSIHGKSW